MNYIKNFYNQLKIVVGSNEPKKINVQVKTNNKYLIKNAILHPIFKDEYNIFKQQKYNIFKENMYDYNNKDESDDCDKLEKDEIKSINNSLKYSLIIGVWNRDDAQLKKRINFSNCACPFYYVPHSCIMTLNSALVNNNLEYGSTELIKKREIWLDNIIKNNLLIVLLVSCYFFKTKFEKNIF